MKQIWIAHRMKQKEPWLVQVVFDKEVLVCSLSNFKRRIKGTGIELDMTYPPTRVAPGRFVGRGFATERTKRRMYLIGGWGTPKRQGVTLFKEVVFPVAPPVTAHPLER
jgi:hypothetical protein